MRVLGGELVQLGKLVLGVLFKDVCRRGRVRIYTGSEKRVLQMMGTLATARLQMAGRGDAGAIIVGVDAHLEGDGRIDNQLDQPAQDELQGRPTKEEKGRLENVTGEPGKD